MLEARGDHTFDNASDRGTVRYHVQRDGVGEREEVLGETDPV